MNEAITTACEGLTTDQTHFFNGYIICLIWSSNTDGQESDGYNITDEHCADDFDSEALQASLDDCLDFIATAGDMLNERSAVTDWESMGHDFALTRNGHGAGFWDRGLIHDDALTKHCKPYGNADLYVGDDGKLYL